MSKVKFHTFKPTRANRRPQNQIQPEKLLLLHGKIMLIPCLLRKLSQKTCFRTLIWTRMDVDRYLGREFPNFQQNCPLSALFTRSCHEFMIGIINYSSVHQSFHNTINHSSIFHHFSCPTGRHR